MDGLHELRGREVSRRAISVVLTALVALASPALLAGCGDEPKKVERNEKGILGDTFTGPTIELPERPIAVAAGEGAVWVTSMAGGVLSAIDPVTHKKIGRPVKTENAPYAVEAAFGKVWVATFDKDVIVRVDPKTRKVIDRIKVDNRPFGMAAANGFMWVTSIRNQSVSRLDPETGERVGERTKLSGIPHQIAAGGDYVWVTNIRDGLVDRLDPKTGELVDSVKAGSFPAAIAAGGRYMWVANVRGDGAPAGATGPSSLKPPSGTLWRLDVKTGEKVGASIPVPIRPYAIASDDENVWVVSVDGDTLLRIDTRTGKRDRLPILIGNAPTDVAIVPSGPAAGEVWVTNSKDDVAALYEPPR